jgi:muramoyltetrapeptide carboxypeptidase
MRSLIGASLMLPSGTAALSNYNDFSSAIFSESTQMTGTVYKSGASENDIIKPKALEKGDFVGIIAPGTNVTDPDDIQKAIEVLQALGLEYKLGKYVLKGSGYKTRSISERLYDLHKAFADTKIKAVVAIRGGYGSGQLLDGIDYDLIRNNPKIFIGYSDITALLLAINKMCNLVTFHGPMLLSPFTEFTTGHFKKILFNKNKNSSNKSEQEASLILKNPSSVSGIREIYSTRTIKEGIAEGELIGGNLSIICSLLGTKYEINVEDKILLLEDVGEEPYKIDRMLNHLRLAGKLQAAKGIIFGQCSECTQKSFIWDYSLGEVLDNYLSRLEAPSFYGLLIGHSSEQMTLPIGIKAKINADSKFIELLENSISQ